MANEKADELRHGRAPRRFRSAGDRIHHAASSPGNMESERAIHERVQAKVVSAQGVQWYLASVIIYYAKDFHMNLTRRVFLRDTGVVAGALPGSTPSLLAAAPAAEAKPNRRMICLCTPLGLHPPDFFPNNTGKD